MSNTCFTSVSAACDVFRAMIIWCTKWSNYLKVVLLTMHHFNTVICYQNDIFCIFLTTKYKRSLISQAKFAPLGSINVTWFRLHFVLNVNVMSVSINYTHVSACAFYLVRRVLMALTSEIQNWYIRLRDGSLKTIKYWVSSVV